MTEPTYLERGLPFQVFTERTDQRQLTRPFLRLEGGAGHARLRFHVETVELFTVHMHTPASIFIINFFIHYYYYIRIAHALVDRSHAV